MSGICWSGRRGSNSRPDRSTECITAHSARRSIEAKLRAYRQALVLPKLGQRLTSYRATFPDGRPPRVLFVLTTGHARRRASILAAAKQVAPEVDVQCVALADTAAIRGACGLCGPRHAEVPDLAQGESAHDRRASSREISDTGIRKLSHFFRVMVRDLRSPPMPEAPRSERLRAAHAAAEVLARFPSASAGRDGSG